MSDRITALLVHQNSETMSTLKAALERQGMRIAQAGSRLAAKRALGGLTPAPLVFTDTHLPDGTWADIIAVAGNTKQPVNVIVVARTVDTRFYVEAIETGAFDFIAPPFNETDLAHVVRSALDNVLARRAVFGITTAQAAKPIVVKMHEAGARLTSG
jgi:DNA-binding NtrC family response regulator